MTAHLRQDLVQGERSWFVFDGFPKPAAPLFHHNAKNITAGKRV